MGDQLKGEDWLPEGLPEGWKVEIRVRKTGKKDRYYTDPVHGYIFRSIKDIDRYLLTGKLGRHVTKTKPMESSSDTAEHDEHKHTEVLEKKELIKSDGMKESCLALEAQGQKVGENASKRKTSTTTDDTKGGMKKRISRPSTGRRACRSSKKQDSTPFFIFDSDLSDETDAIDIPNLSEIIDSMRKEKEDRKTVYISAPAIGSLLGAQTSQTMAKPKQAYNIKPSFSLNPPRQISHNTPNMPYMPFLGQKQEWEAENNVRPYQHALSPFSKVSTDNRPIGVPGCALFGNLLTDPCIDFAFKTLTGTTPFGNDTLVEDCFSPQQLGPSRMFGEGGPCQT